MSQLIFEARKQRDGSIVLIMPDGTITVQKPDELEAIGKAIVEGIENPPETQTEAAPRPSSTGPSRPHAASSAGGDSPPPPSDGPENVTLEDAILGTVLEHAPGAISRLLDFGRKISYQGEKKPE